MKHYVNPKFIPENYQQCTKTVMDNIADPNITFDKNGVCNYYYEYLEEEKEHVFTGEEGKKKLEEGIAKIKASGKGKKYDCVLGVSGGVDSTYLAENIKINISGQVSAKDVPTHYADKHVDLFINAGTTEGLPAHMKV